MSRQYAVGSWQKKYLLATADLFKIRKPLLIDIKDNLFAALLR